MKHIKSVILFTSLLFVFPTSNILADVIVSWQFSPDAYFFTQSDTLDLMAVLYNDSSSSDDFYTDTLAGAGVQWLPGKNLYQEGLNIQFSDLSQEFNNVVLSPGESYVFLWGTVSAWKPVAAGQYTIDYASINGHNSPSSIVADNVFTIYAVPIPSSALLLLAGIVGLFCKRPFRVRRE